MTDPETGAFATPLADAFIGDGIGMPPGLADRLRGLEKYARRLAAQLTAAAARTDAVAAVVRSAGELETLLYDERRSVLLRTLRRPVRHLGEGSAALVTLSRTTKAIFGRARGALALQEAMDAFQAEYREACEGWRELPYASERLLRAARLTPADVARVGRAEDVPPLLQRLRTVRAELDDLASYLPPAAEMAAALERSDAWPADVRPGELLAVARQATHAGPVYDDGGHKRAALIDAARHVSRLAAAGEGSRVASRPSQAVAEALAGQALALPAGAAAVDEALWSGLVRAARRALSTQAEGWLPQLGDVAPAGGGEEGGWGSVQFITPILGDWVLVSRQAYSAVRVRERRVVLGQRFTCAPHTPEGAFAPLDAAERQVAPLFDGLLGDAATYAVAIPAELVAHARVGDEWLARITRRGTLRPARPGASGVRLRVVRSAADPVHEAPVPVQDRGEPVRSFQGVRTRVVDAPYAEHPVAWWKGPEDASPLSRDHLENEAQFFSGLGARMPERMLRPLGAGSCGGVDGLLYAPPPALLPASAPALARWVREARRTFLRAASALFVELGERAYGLGLYHWDAFAVRVTVRSDGEPSPALVVVEAPYAVVLGQAYRRSPPTHVEGPLYPMLGLRRLSPPLEEGAFALPETEVAAFALFALELLSCRPLDLDPRIPWSELPAAVEAQAHGTFANPTLALNFARSLTDVGVAREMDHVIQAYARRPDD